MWECVSTISVVYIVGMCCMLYHSVAHVGRRFCFCMCAAREGTVGTRVLAQTELVLLYHSVAHVGRSIIRLDAETQRMFTTVSATGGVVTVSPSSEGALLHLHLSLFPGHLAHGLLS